MKKEEIHWGDWYRILIGTAPETFLFEVLFRTIFIYLVLLIILRLMGKRMGGQLTIAELSVMLTLGAIVSVPMQAPDKGLIQGVVVLTCALIFQRGTNWLGVKSSKLENIIQGRETMLVKDGIIQVKEMTSTKISHEQLFSILRSEGIFNLGEVERLYLEACGVFSIFKNEDPAAGLSVLPSIDNVDKDVLAIKEEILVCQVCGKSAPKQPHMRCSNCNSDQWKPAIMQL